MDKFSQTKGLIIDLRQYPSDYTVSTLTDYIVDKRAPFLVYSEQSRAVPGTFVFSQPLYSSNAGQKAKFYYDKKIVILMSELSWSQAEFTIMSFRQGSNVVVMGENSIGSDGEVVLLPLPGGNSVSFTSRGVYTPEREQTQRIGLTPDIYVEHTIEGVKEGRDEYIDAAIQYITVN